MTNEMWFKNRDPQLKQYLSELKDSHEIVAIRKDRKLGKRGTAHGGVALFYDSALCSFKKMQLNSLKGEKK